MAKGGFGQRDIRERRIAEREVEWSARPRVEKADHVGGHGRRARPEASRLEVLTERPHSLRVALDERRGEGASRERLDAERAGTGEEVEHAGARERGLEDGEEGLPDPLCRRAGPTAARDD